MPMKSYDTSDFWRDDDPDYAAELERQRHLLAPATEKPCSVGDCVGLFTPDGEYIGGWGPVGCPHEEVDW